MNRKKHFLLILVALVLSFTLAFSLFACNRQTSDPEEGKVDDKALIVNGTFTGVSSETYPKSPSSWSGSAGSSSGSLATPSVVGTDIMNGVINVRSDIYKSNYKKWKLGNANPGKAAVGKDEDNNILMMNNITKTSYRYSSANVNIEKNSYYKVTVNYKTDATAKASIFVLGDAYAELADDKKNTNGLWEQFVVYIEGAADSNKSISVVLANGWGDKNGELSQGVIFYDNVTVEKLEKEDDKDFGKNEYNKAVAENKVTYSMIQSDTEFNYTTGSTSPYTPSKYSGMAGNSEGSDNAPYGSAYTTYGVLDMDDTNFSALGLEDVQKCPNSKGTKMLFINNKQATAYGYSSRVPFIIKANTNYEISMMVRVTGVDAASKHGATLRLVQKGAEPDSSKEFNIKNTDTSVNNGWEQFTFKIKGDKLSDMQLLFELWLGEGGKNNPENWVKGTVYMDMISFKEITPATDASALVDDAPVVAKHEIEIDYNDPIDNTKNMLPGFIMNDVDNGWAQLGAVEDKFDADKYDFYDYNNQTIIEGTNQFKVAEHSVVTPEADKLPAEGLTIKTNEGEVALTQAIKMSLNVPTAYSFIIDKDKIGSGLSIDKSKYYKISMWVRTDLDEKYDGKGLNVKLKQIIDEEDATDTVIASFDNINTTEVETNNHYTQLTFYVQGSDVEDTPIYLEISLGSGTRYTADTHIKGEAYITLIDMEKIEYDDYTKAGTSGNTKKSSLVKSSGATPSIANGNFTDYDIASTYDNYTKHQGVVEVKDEDGTVHEENKKLEFINAEGAYTRPTAPTSWTITNKAYLEAIDTGIVNSQLQLDSIKNGTLNYRDLMESKYPNMDPSNPMSDKDLGGALIISTRTTANADGGFLTVPTSPDTCGCQKCKDEKKDICDGTCGGECLHTKSNGMLPVGYTSTSMSLDANKYYMISVKAKVVDGTASIVLNNNNQDEKITIDKSNTAWQDIRFFINTGLSSASVKLELYLGDKGSKERHPGTVIFDNASFIEIKKAQYDEAVTDTDSLTTKTLKKAYVVDSFNIVKHDSETLEAVPNWDGSVIGEGSSKDEDLVKGVFDKNYTRNNVLKTVDKDGVTTELKDSVYSFLLSDAVADNNFLVINNVTPNAYSFTNNHTAKTLAKNSYYRVSVKVLTYGLKATEAAHITLKLNNATYAFDKADNDDATKKVLVNTSTYAEDGTETLGNWTTYTFYVSTPAEEQVKDVTITLGLGKDNDVEDKDKKKDNFVQGYAFFDDVEFTAIEKEVFEKNAKDDSINKKIVLTNEDVLKKPEDDKKDDEAHPENNLLWLYITSGVIGGLTLLVIVVAVLKKYWPAITRFFNKKTGKNMSDYDKNNPNANKDQKKTNKSKNEFKD